MVHKKKVSVTGSVSNISTKELAKISTPSLSNTLGGQIPGIVTRQAIGEPGMIRPKFIFVVLVLGQIEILWFWLMELSEI